MTLSVLIPCYLRADNLLLNLNALKKQTRLPDQVVVAVRTSDHLVRDFVRDYDAFPLSLTIADAPEVGGFSAAINAGLQCVTGEIVALTDDDTEAYPDWLARIEAYYQSDARIGGVGGRDVQSHAPVGTEAVVGIVTWWGNCIGNHHIGKGEPRPVDVLKGCNCSYRTAPFRSVGFDTRLLGKGMQMNTEIALGLCFRRAGWKLIYDPDVALHHHAAQRFDNDQRGVVFNEEARFNQAHNLALSLWEHFGVGRRIAFLLYRIFVGNRADPGLLQIVRLAPSDRDVLRNAYAGWRGLRAGIATASRTKRPETLTPEQVASVPAGELQAR